MKTTTNSNTMQTNDGRLRKWWGNIRNQQYVVTAVFLLVPLTLFAVFTLTPFLKMVQFSFYEMKYIGSRTFVGLENYKTVFMREDIFNALRLSLYYFVASFVQLALALFFATLLSFKTRFSGFFKGALFFPYLVCGIAIGFIFKFFFTHGYVFDTILSWVGFSVDNLPYWLRDTSVNNMSLAATSVWRYMGQNMVLFIGAIMSVDPTLYEAADIDGANAWQRFTRIILPSIRTIVVLNLILSISGSISVFEQPYVITNGSFGTGTYFVIMNTVAHTNQKVGLASAMAIILLGIIVLVTALQKLISHVFLDEDANGMTFFERRDRSKRAKQGAGKGISL